MPSTSPGTAAEPSRYCKQCGYDLRGCREQRCPECGRGFDPGNPQTYAKRPSQDWRWLKRGLAAFLTVLALMGGAWGWLWWEWHAEQQALARLRGLGVRIPTTFGPGWGGAGWGVHCIQSTAFSIGPKWLGKYLGPAALVLDRVICLDGYESKVTDDELGLLKAVTWLEYVELDKTAVSDLAVLSRLTGLQGLRLRNTKVSNLSPLANLTGMLELRFADTPVADLTPVAKLTGLKKLDCSGTQVADLAPLTNLRGLRELYFSNTQVSDLSPLASLTGLEYLYCDGTQVTDLSPLAKLTALKYVYVPKETITESQMQELQRALPRCNIERK